MKTQVWQSTIPWLLFFNVYTELQVSDKYRNVSTSETTDSPWCFLFISCFSYWEKMVDPEAFPLPSLSEGNISLTVSIYHSASFQLQVRATWLLIWKTIYVHTEKLLPFFYFMLWQVSFSVASFLSPIFLDHFQNRVFNNILHISSWFSSTYYRFNIIQLHQRPPQKKTNPKKPQ